MLGISSLPAAVHQGRGLWHVELARPRRTENVGGVQFREGRSVRPVQARIVRAIVGVCPRRVLRFYMVDRQGELLVDDEGIPRCLVGAPLTEQVEEAEALAIESLDKPALVELAEAEGIEIDKRWGRDRLLSAVLEHFGDGGEGDGEPDAPQDDVPEGGEGEPDEG